MKDIDTMTEAQRLVAYVRQLVVESTGYRSRFTNTAQPIASRFVRTLERELMQSGATLKETNDPAHSIRQRTHLPQPSWPYSVWVLPTDSSVVAVFENHAETAASMTHVMQYASVPNTTKGTRFAGHWDGASADELAMALQRAISRVVGTNELTMQSALMFGMISVPFSDRIDPDHPLREIGYLHGIDTKGVAVFSSEQSGPLFVMPTDIEGMVAKKHESMRLAKRFSDLAIGAPFAEHHNAIAAFYTKIIDVVAPYERSKQQGLIATDTDMNDAADSDADYALANGTSGPS